jgi:hypothetical protein
LFPNMEEKVEEWPFLRPLHAFKNESSICVICWGCQLCA